MLKSSHAVLAIAFVACSVQAPHEHHALDATEAPLTLPSPRELLRSYVDLSSSQLSSGVSAADVPVQQAIDVSVFEAQLAQLVGASVDARWDTGLAHYARIGTLTSTIVAESRSVNVTDSRGYADVEGASPSSQQLLDTSLTLLAGMGIDAREVVTEVAPMGSQAAPHSDVERLATKVFCFRSVGGLRVGGNRMVFSYANDGTLRAIRGDWPPLDVQASQWSTHLTSDEIVSRSLDAMLEAGASVESTLPIAVTTYYAPTQASDGVWVLDLRATATRQAGGPDDSGGRGASYEADL